MVTENNEDDALVCAVCGRGFYRENTKMGNLVLHYKKHINRYGGHYHGRAIGETPPKRHMCKTTTKSSGYPE